MANACRHVQYILAAAQPEPCNDGFLVEIVPHAHLAHHPRDVTDVLIGGPHLDALILHARRPVIAQLQHLLARQIVHRAVASDLDQDFDSPLLLP
jgi:hypothetical protein